MELTLLAKDTQSGKQGCLSVYLDEEGWLVIQGDLLDPAPGSTFATCSPGRAPCGRTQQRVHVITEPVSDYLVYELTWEYGPHAAAGEDIRIIPVTTGWLLDVPSQDFWLFDSTALFDMYYDPNGFWLGVEPVTDPARVAAACFARDAALHHSVPWRAYLTHHPELEQRLIPAWR